MTTSRQDTPGTSTPCQRDIVPGDMCSDTAPMPLAYTCTEPSIAQYPDQCMQSRGSWKNAPTHNYMSYTDDQSCRTEFTSHQTQRLRCYADAIMKGDLGTPWPSAAAAGSRPQAFFSATALYLAVLAFAALATLPMALLYTS